MNAGPERHRPAGVSCPASELASGGWLPPGPLLLTSPGPPLGKGSPIYTNTERLTSGAPIIPWDGRDGDTGNDGSEKRDDRARDVRDCIIRCDV
jgi:hypothetical protein